MKKLEKKLTFEQEKLMHKTRDEWLDYIFSCSNTLNKEQAEKGINWMYRLSNLKDPTIVWLDSPMGLQIAANVVCQILEDKNIRASVGDSVRASVRASVGASVGDSVGDSVGASVWASVRDSVGASVGASVRDSVRASVRDSVGASVRASVGASVGDSVGASVGDSVGASVWASVRDSVRASVRASVGDSVGASVWASVRDSVGASVGDSELKYYSFCSYGSIGDYSWVSFYDFFQRIKIFENENFNQFKSLLRSGIYDMIQLKGVCFVCGLPNQIIRNNRTKPNQLHCEDGPAITFNDGYELHFWKGITVPKKLIESPDNIQKKDLEKNQNAEVRRAFIEKLGVEKYYQILSGGEGLKTVDEDVDNQGLPMKLFEFGFEGETIQVLQVICPSTDRNYNLYPPNQKSTNVWEAKASTFNMKQEEFKPVLES